MIKKFSNINIILRPVLLETINKKLNKKKFHLITLTNFRFKTLLIKNIY